MEGFLCVLGALCGSTATFGLSSHSRKEIAMLSFTTGHLRHVTTRAGRWIVAGLGTVSLLLATAEAAQLSLTWSDMSSNEDGFHIQRKTGTGGAYGTIATPPAGTTGYVDGMVTAGTTYCYRVSAYNTAGDSSYSNEACAAPVAATTYAVTVTKAGSGTGTVASSPAGINCGSDCTEAYAAGTQRGPLRHPGHRLHLHRLERRLHRDRGLCPGSGWAEEPHRHLRPPDLRPLGPKAAAPAQAPYLNATGINCGTDCTETYNYNTSVTLTAAATTGSTFTGWSGAAAAGPGPAP